MYLYNNIKIKGAWNHDDGRSISAGWVDGATAEQLIDYDVTEIPDIEPPVYDSITHYITEQLDGSYITTAYSQAEIDDRALANDIQKIIGAVKDIAFIQIELVDKLIQQGTIIATDFTPAVKQAYQDLKTIVDRIK